MTCQGLIQLQHRCHFHTCEHSYLNGLMTISTYSPLTHKMIQAWACIISFHNIAHTPWIILMMLQASTRCQLHDKSFVPGRLAQHPAACVEHMSCGSPAACTVHTQGTGSREHASTAPTCRCRCTLMQTSTALQHAVLAGPAASISTSPAL